MARVTFVRAAQQRYEQTVVLNEDGTPKRTPVMSRRTGEQKVSKKGPVFLTVKVDDKTRPKPLLVCDYCSNTIEIGTPYKHVTPKSGPYGGFQRSRHASCPTWRPSQLSSSKMAGIMAAQEAFEDVINTLETKDDIQDAVNEVAEAAREVAGEYEESAQNMEDGFGHETENSDALREKARSLNDWADELESAMDGENDEPDVDHQTYYVANADGTRAIEDNFDSEDDAQVALDAYIAENDVEDDIAAALYIEGEDAEEANDEETEVWLDQLRSTASDAINKVPV